MNILLDLFLTFAKVGVFTFGGGYAMIAMITNWFLQHRFCRCNPFPFYFAHFAPTQMKNAPNFRVPFYLALCIKISVGSQINIIRTFIQSETGSDLLFYLKTLRCDLKNSYRLWQELLILN